MSAAGCTGVSECVLRKYSEVENQEMKQKGAV